MTCAHCSSPLTEPHASCAKCEALYHVECFVDNKKCAILGCNSEVLKLSDSESFLPVSNQTIDTFVAQCETKQHLGMQPDVLAELVCAEMNVNHDTKQLLCSLQKELGVADKKYFGNPLKHAAIGSVAVCLGIEVIEHLFFTPGGFGLLPYFTATIFGAYAGAYWKPSRKSGQTKEEEKTAIIQRYRLMLP